MREKYVGKKVQGGKRVFGLNMPDEGGGGPWESFHMPPSFEKQRPRCSSTPLECFILPFTGSSGSLLL